MLVFLGILIVGYAYVWAKGDLEWDKPMPRFLTNQQRTTVFEEKEETTIH
ncbi:MAG: NADH-quinone oxidoreductase subunit A [Bacteroidota bacterium]